MSCCQSTVPILLGLRQEKEDSPNAFLPVLRAVATLNCLIPPFHGLIRGKKMTDSEGEGLGNGSFPGIDSRAAQTFERTLIDRLNTRGQIPISEIAISSGYPEDSCVNMLRRSRQIRVTSEGMATLVKKHRRPLAKSAVGATWRGETGGATVGKVGYLCIADEFNLQEMRLHYQNQGYHTQLAFDVLHVADRKEEFGYGSTSPSNRAFDLFIFAYGSVVWWGYDQRHYSMVESDFIIPSSKISKWIVGRYKASIIYNNFPVWCEFSADWREISMNPGEPDQVFRDKLNYDHFYVPRDSVDHKLCISHGLAQSAKIDYIEIKVRELTQNCKPLPRELKEKGSVTISERKLLQLRGEVLFYRLMLKSGSDLLDEPELFWQFTFLKPFYVYTKNFFEITERVETLDAKLEADNQIVSMITDHFNQRHGSRLEWIVIWLVMVEVIIGLMELLLDLKPWLV
jgi:uncharacterized Rmd1/YagE family protein